MEGVLRVEGPALDWRAMKAELTIPRFQLGPAPEVDIAAEALTGGSDAPLALAAEPGDRGSKSWCSTSIPGTATTRRRGTGN